MSSQQMTKHECERPNPVRNKAYNAFLRGVEDISGAYLNLKYNTHPSGKFGWETVRTNKRNMAFRIHPQSCKTSHAMRPSETGKPYASQIQLDMFACNVKKRDRACHHNRQFEFN